MTGIAPITRKEFEAYEAVRASGEFNMITQADEAAAAARLSTQRYMEVLQNYDACKKRWPRPGSEA